jgi:hypothetical protein
MISAGKMPTLAARNCTKPQLTQIQSNLTAASVSAKELKPAEGPAPRNNSWPA